jgi:hypothetical protein
VITKSKSIGALVMGAVLLGISSCASVETQPLAPGELRLLSMAVPEWEKIGGNSPFMVHISFEADGKPEIRSACFEFSGDGPYCFKVSDMNYGSPGTIRVQIKTTNPGGHLKGYVSYIRGGKVETTNVVSTSAPTSTHH